MLSRSCRTTIRLPAQRLRRAFGSSDTPIYRYNLNQRLPDIGDDVHGYQVKNVCEIPRLDMILLDLQHVKTSARHLHAARNDPTKVFSVGFKTNPPDLTGLPHILEHTTLCGSEKYPVRDPFFAMLSRSLSNFMNAMTGLDYTFYPFSTSNLKDYRNLQDVYLDAVFNPLLREKDFKQEGWRLEHEVAEDSTTPLIFKGVVYHEMKGMFVSIFYCFPSS
jgi:presequence protease